MCQVDQRRGRGIHRGDAGGIEELILGWIGKTLGKYRSSSAELELSLAGRSRRNTNFPTSNSIHMSTDNLVKFQF